MDRMLVNLQPEITALQAIYGERLQVNVPLSRYTSARVGGPADAFLTAGSVRDLVEIVLRLWEMEMPFYLFGGGSNILVSDSGIRGVVIHNMAKQVRFNQSQTPPTVWAASGVNLGSLARQVAARGLGGLEWAAGIPGTVGGAVVGNAGAHDGDVAGNLVVAEILHRQVESPDSQFQGAMEIRREVWPVNRMGFAYRTSRIKRDYIENVLSNENRLSTDKSGQQPGTIVLAAVLNLALSSKEAVQAKMDKYLAYRRQTQPPGASMGSMFKNPSGDYAGRLIEAVGLKGFRQGNAQISPLHANFFINLGNATAADVFSLLKLAQDTVAEKLDVFLELEIELVGSWES